MGGESSKPVSISKVHADAPRFANQNHLVENTARARLPESCGVPEPNGAIPIVLRYAGKDVGERLKAKQPMFVRTGGERIPLVPSADCYYILMSLPAGQHEIVFEGPDGSLFPDDSQPVTPDGGSNFVTVTAALLLKKDDDDPLRDTEGWSQKEHTFDETRKYPPLLPLHLRYTPLNTPPPPMWTDRSGRLHSEGSLDSVNLPLPLSVTVNHVYLQRRQDHVVTGVTTRYRNKYTTTVYYRGLPEQK